jgi:predicted alpha/beta hydrolase family esterase
VASSNDPFGNLEFAQSCALAWGSRFAGAGAVGHINSNSGLGEWREGFALFQQLAA